MRWSQIGKASVMARYKTMKYKAFFCDVDGTLIGGETGALPSQRVREAIIKAKEKIHVGVATSRPWNKMKDIAGALNLSGPSIVSGGAEIVDAVSGRVFREYPIDKNLIAPICAKLKEFGARLWIQDSGADYDFNETYIPHKPFVIVAHGLLENLADAIMKSLSEFRGVQANKAPTYAGGLFDVLVTHELGTKYHAVREAMLILNISPEEIIGIGDGHNDIPLLKACGLKIAMGNAVPELKAIADYVAPAVENDGVADAIEKFII